MKRPFSLLRSLRYGAEAFLLVLFYGLFRFMPLDAASWVGGAVFRTLGPHLAVTRIARRNMEKALPDQVHNHERYIKDMWENLGRLIAEWPHMQRLSSHSFAQRVEVIGRERLMDFKTTPGLIVTAHIGNWEILPRLGIELELPMALVYRQANNPIANALMVACRHHPLLDVIPKGPKGGRQIVKTMQSNRTLAMLVDQKMNDGIAVPFFGHPAMTAPALARLAIQFDRPIVPMRVERLKGAHFRVTAFPPLLWQKTGDQEADILHIMTLVNQQIESWIKDNPGQWFWLHKRWGKE